MRESAYLSTRTFWGPMNRETELSADDAYETAGRLYREAALYIASFQAYIQLHEMRMEENLLSVELGESRLDEADRKLLR